jgi:hypothetical protein
MNNRTKRIEDVISHDPGACKLIEEYLPQVPRKAWYWSQFYPFEDWEVLITQALYMAAFTHKPGPAGFYKWWEFKIRSKVSGVRKRVVNAHLGWKPIGCKVKTQNLPRIKPPKRAAWIEQQIAERFYYKNELDI